MNEPPKFRNAVFHQRIPWGVGLAVGIGVVLLGMVFYRSNHLPLDVVGFLGLLHAGMGFGFFSGFVFYLYLQRGMKK